MTWLGKSMVDWSDQSANEPVGFMGWQGMAENFAHKVSCSMDYALYFILIFVEKSQKNHEI